MECDYAVNIKNMSIELYLNNKCSYFQETKKKYIVSEIIPANLCPLAYIAIYPYIYTLKNNGFFGWMKKKNTVCAQCPSNKNKVNFLIIKENDYISLKVDSIKNFCIAGHKKGDTYIIKNKIKSFCLKALHIIIPYLFVLDKVQTNELFVRCPGSEKNVVFKIKKK